LEKGKEAYQKSREAEEGMGKMFVPTVVMLALATVPLAVALLGPKLTIV